MSTWREFTDYSPGGAPPHMRLRSQRRRLYKQYCRKGGIASGVKRRQLSPGRRQARRQTRDQALNLAYRHKQPNEEQLRILYFTVRPNGNEGGFQTYREHVSGLWRRYRHEGQHFRTTNAQRGQHLLTRERPRSRRQVQRLNRLVEETGLAWVLHHKAGGAEVGNKDCLVVEIRSFDSKNVTPPPGAGAGPRTSPRSCSPSGEKTEEIPPASPAVPPDGGDHPPPFGGGRHLTEKEEEEARLRLIQMKLDAGWTLRYRDRVFLARHGPGSRSRPHGDSDARCSEQ